MPYCLGLNETDTLQIVQRNHSFPQRQLREEQLSLCDGELHSNVGRQVSSECLERL